MISGGEVERIVQQDIIIMMQATSDRPNGIILTAPEFYTDCGTGASILGLLES